MSKTYFVSVLTVLTAVFETETDFMCVSLSCSCVRVVHSGTNNTYTMPVMLSFWGKEENKSTVMEKLAQRGFKLNAGEGGAAGINGLKSTASIPCTKKFQVQIQSQTSITAKVLGHRCIKKA